MLGLTALPTILSALKNPWVLLLVACVAGAGSTAWYRMRWLDCSAGQERAIADAQKKADDLANELVIAQAQAMAVTEKTVTVFRDRIVHAAQTNSCGPSVRDALRGVRATLDGGQPDAPSGAPAGMHPAPTR